MYLLYPKRKARDDEWLTFSRADRLGALDEPSESGWRLIRDVFASSTPIDALIHRNTRHTLRKYEQVGLLDTTVPDREPEQHRIDLTEETRTVYDRIDDYTRKFYKLAQQSDEADSRAIWLRDDYVSAAAHQQYLRDFTEPSDATGNTPSTAGSCRE